MEVISNLSSEYETKKITITKNEEFQLIDKWMKWADICWFEWCDELVIYGSSQSIAKRKKLSAGCIVMKLSQDFPIK
ncbi:glycosyltransferase [Halalkalibacter wakoensis JCM 9140]|uniref:Glycosyltransferase n=1 Tax=Halalkalibacter wakoensis JCM 9140 TaxID=1236970 RepID=W4Q3K7_9BACI|nr:glycosyltransferase [Halalkalibacter wakoensis JCM 9140]